MRLIDVPVFDVVLVHTDEPKGNVISGVSADVYEGAIVSVVAYFLSERHAIIPKRPFGNNVHHATRRKRSVEKRCWTLDHFHTLDVRRIDNLGPSRAVTQWKSAGRKPTDGKKGITGGEPWFLRRNTW